MTLEELVACDNAPPADPSPPSGPLRDPDSVVLCLLAIDEEEEDDIALQIHFTLIQSFCCDNDINIVRVSGMQRLAQLLGEPAETQGTTEARDLHCLLVTVSWAWTCPTLPRAPAPVFVNKVELAHLGPACPVGSLAGASLPGELF
uniref:Growth arrest and DNA damage inducible beta n=1 Tax=Panthera tigris altaica TaxID=74533 RepID=A0A8C9K1A1_PANTA